MGRRRNLPAAPGERPHHAQVGAAHRLGSPDAEKHVSGLYLLYDSLGSCLVMRGAVRRRPLSSTCGAWASLFRVFGLRYTLRTHHERGFAVSVRLLAWAPLPPVFTSSAPSAPRSHLRVDVRLLTKLFHPCIVCFLQALDTPFDSCIYRVVVPHPVRCCCLLFDRQHGVGKTQARGATRLHRVRTPAVPPPQGVCDLRGLREGGRGRGT